MNSGKRKANELYANLMHEAKVRLDCLGNACLGRTGYPKPIVREFCYLQLRMLCELIALACLVAHGDMKSLQSHKTGKAYSADDILGMLERLRPHFYPFACIQKLSAKGVNELSILNPQPLPKDKLLELYGKTHQHLHRGSLRKLLSENTPIDMNLNLPEIIGWAGRIDRLLSVHTIAISEVEVLHCILRNKDNQGKVQVVTANANRDLTI